MIFTYDKAVEILKSTPHVLESLLGGLSSEWLYSNEGEKTWSPYQVLGHLIHGENTDWLPRAYKMLKETNPKFEPFDRFAQEILYKDQSVPGLLRTFKGARQKSLTELSNFKLDDRALSRTGIHPEFGTVTLSQHLATWVVHDLDHINQISRVMAKQYRNAVGPWVKYLGVLHRPI